MFQVSRLDYNRLGFGSTRMPDNAHQGLLHEKGATSQSATPRPSTVAGEGNAFHNAPASQAHAQPHVAV